MSLKVTRKIIDAVHSGELNSASFEEFPVFGFKIPKSIQGVQPEILMPKNTWADKAAFDE
jgi:phosphoenolpyruvate carboxykinase (ATP)